MNRNKIKVKDLMTLERILLEMETLIKFELAFDDAYRLNCYITEIGKITDFAFLIQREYGNVTKDEDKMKEYHERTMDSIVDYDYAEVAEFIERILSIHPNEEMKKMVDGLKFW